MSLRRSLLSTFIGPSLCCGAAGGIGVYWWTQNSVAAACVLATCVVGAAASFTVAARQSRRAEAQLRSPEFRTGKTHAAGIYADLLDTAQSLIADLRQKADESSQARTKMEARNHMRKKQALQFERALACIEQPVMITDGRGRVLYGNPAVCALFRRIPSDSGKPGAESGGRRGDVFGQSEIGDLKSEITVDRIPELQSLLDDACSREAATDRRTTDFELADTGGTVAYHATATNIADDAGALLGTVTVVEDVSVENRDKTRHAEFVSSVSHEFKTPMASIKAFTEMLVDGEVTDPDELHEVYGFIESQIDRLTRMVDNILNLTRIESGVIQVRREDCELNDVLNTALRVVQPTAEEKQIRVVSELSDLYLAAHVDRDLLGQAVINLLSNAVKYTPEGGEVRLRSRMDESQAIIEVADTGMGIPADSLPRIFERFYRVPENNKAASGTGLGLALVHYIVTELHNGALSVQSTVGEGTTMTIALPLGHRRQTRKQSDAAPCTV